MRRWVGYDSAELSWAAAPCSWARLTPQYYHWCSTPRSVWLSCRQYDPGESVLPESAARPIKSGKHCPWTQPLLPNYSYVNIDFIITYLLIFYYYIPPIITIAISLIIFYYVVYNILLHIIFYLILFYLILSYLSLPMSIFYHAIEATIRLDADSYSTRLTLLNCSSCSSMMCFSFLLFMMIQMGTMRIMLDECAILFDITFSRLLCTVLQNNTVQITYIIIFITLIIVLSLSNSWFDSSVTLTDNTLI